MDSIGPTAHAFVLGSWEPCVIAFPLPPSIRLTPMSSAFCFSRTAAAALAVAAIRPAPFDLLNRPCRIPLWSMRKLHVTEVPGFHGIIACIIGNAGGVMATPRTVFCKRCFPALILRLLLAFLVPVVSYGDHHSQPLRRSDFPGGFVFGSSTSAYQVEGAVAEGGRGLSVWDTHTHLPGTIADNTTADEACDQYHRYEEDVNLMADIGMDAYRFSISWSRIFPEGRGRVNPEGVAYYNRLIDALLARGIQPWVVLYHWDLPQALQDSLGGWLNPQIVSLFGEYAEVCFAAFGDRVTHWGTFNEIHHIAFTYSNVGCRSSQFCGDPRRKPYLIGHHMLLSHAVAVQCYRSKFQERQRGSIGIILDVQWYEPVSDLQEDIDAADRMMVFQIQWLMDPLVHGHYPASMCNDLPDKLPTFSEEEAKDLKGSFDFIGLNHYTTHYAKNDPSGPEFSRFGVEFHDARTASISVKNGIPIGPQAGSPWLNIVPWGMGKVLNRFKLMYNNPLIYITENGVDEADDLRVPTEVMLQDEFRIQYHHDYLTYVIGAMRNGSNIGGYFVWSFLDNFEWEDGFSKRFGLFYVDFKNGLRRMPKASVAWFKELLQRPGGRDHSVVQKKAEEPPWSLALRSI